MADVEERKVFVGGLRPEATSDILANYFGQFGDMEEVKVIMDRTTGRSKGYGFVTFRSTESARNALVNPHPLIDGKQANCNLAAEGKNGTGGGGTTGALATGKRKLEDSSATYPTKQAKFDSQSPEQMYMYQMSMLNSMAQPYLAYQHYSQAYQPQVPSIATPTAPTTSLSPPQTQGGGGGGTGGGQPTNEDIMNMLLSLKSEVQQLRAEIAPLLARAAASNIPPNF